MHSLETKLKMLSVAELLKELSDQLKNFHRLVLNVLDMQYLYSDGDLFNFMNNETYDQIAISPGYRRRFSEIRKRERNCKSMFLQRKRIRD